MASNPSQIKSADLFFFFSSCLPNPSINHLNFYCIYKTNRLHFSGRIYCNRSQKTSQCAKNNSHATRLRLLSYFVFFTRCNVICDLLQYTHTEKCNLFVKYKTIEIHITLLGFNYSENKLKA